MNPLDLAVSAVGNSFRSKTRTILTVIAIFIGAFTLTLTSGVGTGINRYIDDTVSSIGAADVMTVNKTVEATGDGPQLYDPSSTQVESQLAGPPGASTLEAMTSEDIAELTTINGVESAEPTLSVSPDYIQYGDGDQYQVSVGSVIPGITLQLAAGDQPQYNADDYQVAIPESYLEPLGFADADAAVGETIALGLTNTQGASSTLEATVVGVAEPGLTQSSSVSANDSLTRALYDGQSVGLGDAARDSYAQAVVRFDADATDDEITALKEALADAGYTGTTVDDQIGAFKTIIDAIVLVLNGFAGIALIAAGFGIVNTLLMSVQERTREIGLMKAMGMGGGRIFTLFSLEAVFIGFLGSAIGVGAGMLVGTLANTALADTLLADLPGLTLLAFDPVSLATIVLVVMGIAFAAGTIPALRAAKADPIESLRYE
ncbi:MAG TPA: ABC transporter permease [Glaciihabitans sp.]|jgi:putative ABC transport system permease protein|nr:ABC transporter permease [Glaciihabitans sp.]